MRTRVRFAVALAVLLVPFLALDAAAQKGKPKPGGGGGGSPPDPAICFAADASAGPQKNALMVADADGGNPTELLYSEVVGYFFPAWSPDLDPAPGFQGKIVYEQWSGPYDAPVIDIYTVDVVVDAAGVRGENNQLLVQNAFLPAWSPQGDKIAYVGNHDAPEGIYVLDLETDVSTLVCANLNAGVWWMQYPYPSYEEFSWPAWSPDGTTLAFSRGWYDEVTELGGSEIATKIVVDALGNLITDGAQTTVVEGGGSSIDWSRDGLFLAYRAGNELRVVDLLGAAPPLALPSTQWAEQPTWPPDRSDQLAFMSRRGDSGSGKRKIVLRDLTTQVEVDLIERKGWHLYEPDWRRE